MQPGLGLSLGLEGGEPATTSCAHHVQLPCLQMAVTARMIIGDELCCRHCAPVCLLAPASGHTAAPALQAQLAMCTASRKAPIRAKLTSFVVVSIPQ